MKGRRRCIWLWAVLSPALALSGCIDREPPTEPEIYVSPESDIYARDHLTGASFLVLDQKGSYQIVSQEHMGVWVTENGEWNKAQSEITFHPADPAKKSYRTALNSYKGREFLVLLDEGGPGARISAEEIRKEIDDADREPGTGPPPYVFLRANTEKAKGELGMTYPFKVYPEMNR